MLLYKLNKEKYNILFLDPPFKDKEYTKDLKILKKNSNLYKNHIIIIHREKRTSENLDDTLNIKTIRQYGRSKIIFGNLGKKKFCRNFYLFYRWLIKRV